MTPLSKRTLVFLLFGFVLVLGTTSAAVPEDTHASDYAISVEAKGFSVAADVKTRRKLDCVGTALSTTTAPATEAPPNASSIYGRGIYVNYFEIKNTHQSASITLTNQIDIDYINTSDIQNNLVVYVRPGALPAYGDSTPQLWTSLGGGSITPGSSGPTTVTLSRNFTPLTIEPGQTFGMIVSANAGRINWWDPSVPVQKQYGGTADSPLQITGFYGGFLPDDIGGPNGHPYPYSFLFHNDFAGTLHYTLDPWVHLAVPTVKEGDLQVTFDASGSTDLADKTRTFAFSLDGTEVCPASATATCDYTGGLLKDDSTGLVSVEVCYSCGTCMTTTDTLTVDNVAPLMTASDISVNHFLIKKGVQSTITVSFTDPGTLDTQSLDIDWGDHTTENFVAVTSGSSFSHTYKKTGSFPVKVSVSDNNGGVTSVTASSPIVVKIPLSSLTAKGSMTTPAAAIPHRSLRASDKAKFNVSVSTINGQSVPGGSLLIFSYTNVAFVGTCYESIIVDPTGKCAKVTGSGTVNGTGDFGFSAIGCDAGATDTFHMKIWDKKNGDAIIYDNVPGIPDTDFSGTNLGSGSVAVTTNGV